MVLFAAFALLATFSLAQPASDQVGAIQIHAIEHASLALQTPEKLIFVDPVQHADAFNALGAPDLLLLTDIHGDHFSPETLDQLQLDHTPLVVPQAVADKLPERYKTQTVILHNGDVKMIAGLSIKALPMYNLPESADAFHPKGRGNGYLLELDGKNVYISGDTEGTPEMRNLKGIDIAFVCMNLPYTMDIHQAADAVLDFKPRIIYPYHYGKSDVAAFKKEVESKNSAIDVRLLQWYPKGK